jgi:hypothetical protein
VNDTNLTPDLAIMNLKFIKFTKIKIINNKKYWLTKMKIQLHLKLLNNTNGKVFKLKCNRILDKQLKKNVEIWYKNFVDRSYRGPRPRRDNTVKKNGWFSIGGCCPSGGGEDDRTGLL